MNIGLIALLIIVGIVVGAILTRRCTEFLVLGSIVGAIFLFGQNFMTEWLEILQNVCADNVWLILVCGLFGSLIALLQESKGSLGFSKLISKFCNTERKTLLTSFILGILIFVDDYLNVLSIGVCMKGVYDKRKIPRESLAFMLDSTGAPVCVLLPFSTWAVFFSSIFMEEKSVQDLGYSSAMDAYCSTIPFMFYPIIILIIVFLFAVGIMPKIGAMKKAYRRVEETGKVYSDVSKKYNHDERKGFIEDGNILDFAIPMIILVAIAVITSDLLLAVVIAIISCILLYIPRKIIPISEFLNVAIKGFCDMMPIFFMLMPALTLAEITSQLKLTDFLVDVLNPVLTGSLFPVITFLLVSVLAFVTGSNWGMSAVVVPIVFPLGAAVGANPLLIMAAVVSGGAFGSHACFYTDSTLLASTGAGIDNFEHATSQVPYVMIAAGLSAIGFLVAGFVV